MPAACTRTTFFMSEVQLFIFHILAAGLFKIDFDGSVGKESTCNSGTQETKVRSLGREDPLEKEMTTHSSILA